MDGAVFTAITPENNGFFTPAPSGRLLFARYYSIIRSRSKPVAESFFRDCDNPAAPMGGKVYGKRSADSVVKARQHRLYKRQLDGMPTRHLVLDHATKEQIAESTAWRDWNAVMSMNEEDWEKDRESMLSRIQQMRVRLFNQAVKKGQLQTAAQILDSLGKVIGESVETVNIQAPELSIRIEDKK